MVVLEPHCFSSVSQQPTTTDNNFPLFHARRRSSSRTTVGFVKTAFFSQLFHVPGRSSKRTTVGLVRTLRFSLVPRSWALLVTSNCWVCKDSVFIPLFQAPGGSSKRTSVGFVKAVRVPVVPRSWALLVTNNCRVCNSSFLFFPLFHAPGRSS